VADEVQADLAGLQDALLKTDGVEEFLHELAVLSTRMVSGELSCGMSLRHRGRPALVTACSDPLASAADDVQYQASDGPCLYAMRHARPVLIDDTAAHDQWIRFCDQAAAAGIRSCYALPLIADGEPLGALILYSRQPSAFGPAETEQAVTFAGHAAGALALSLRMSSYIDLNGQLKSSIASRAVIDQAT
jgi:GAF domain-containing protein